MPEMLGARCLDAALSSRMGRLRASSTAVGTHVLCTARHRLSIVAPGGEVSVELRFKCSGCSAEIDGTAPMRKEFVSVSGRAYGIGSARWIEPPDALAPPGWVAADPYTYCTYCPKCWAEINRESAPPPGETTICMLHGCEYAQHDCCARCGAPPCCECQCPSPAESAE